jgi:hypothetical protein
VNHVEVSKMTLPSQKVAIKTIWGIFARAGFHEKFNIQRRNHGRFSSIARDAEALKSNHDSQ